MSMLNKFFVFSLATILSAPIALAADDSVVANPDNQMATAAPANAEAATPAAKPVKKVKKHVSRKAKKKAEVKADATDAANPVQEAAVK